MMRTAILAVAVLVLAVGCDGRKQVPVSEPTMTFQEQAPAVAVEPVPTGAPTPAPMPAPSPTPAPSPSSGGPRGDWGAASSPAQSAPHGHGQLSLQDAVSAGGSILHIEDKLATKGAAQQLATAESSPSPATGEQAGQTPAADTSAPGDSPMSLASLGGPVGASTPARPPVQPTGKPKVVCASLMQINDQFLTIDDLLRTAAVELSGLPAAISEQTFREQARTILEDQARRQTRRLLVYPEAQARIGEQIKEWVDDEMDQALRDLIARADGSRRKLETDLRQQHTSLEEVLENQRQQLVVQEFLRWKFLPGVSVTRTMMLDYYRGHPEEFDSPPEVQMQIIAAPYDAFLGRTPLELATLGQMKAARQEAQALIAQAQAALRNGEDFADVARRLSKGYKAEQGGLWTMMPAGSFRIEPVEQAAFAMGQGQVSDIIETPEGSFIVKAYEVKPGGQTGFEQAQAGIERKLRELSLMKRYDEYYKQVLAKATIVDSGNVVATAVDRAVELFWREGPVE